MSMTAPARGCSKGLNLRVAVISGEQIFSPGQNLKLVAFDVDLDDQRFAGEGERLIERNDLNFVTARMRRHDAR